MHTATIPMGYADGFGLRLSNKGFVFYGNTKLKMLGTNFNGLNNY